MHILRRYKLVIYILLLSFVGGFFRFYNLNWGNPFYFHPDERNIASSVIQMNFPNQMNPHFFAYGSFPIYLIYFTSYLLNFFQKSHPSFEQTIIISRFYSALLSLTIIPSIYFIGKKLADKKVGLIAAIFCAFSVGLIQFAHFGTFEIWLTFLGIWLFYFSLKLVKNLNLKNIIIVGIIFGLLMATKISSLPLLIVPLISIILNLLPKLKIQIYLSISKIIFKTLILILISLITFILFSPYVFLDNSSVLSSIKYESSVALGTLPIFYTGEFFKSIPILFQFTKIYPFLINPLMTIIFVPSLIYLTLTAFRKNNFPYYLLFAIYNLLFLSQAFLFTKWARYILLTLPFMYLITAIFLGRFINKKIFNIIIIIIFISIVFAASYFITAFVKEDTRIQASIFAKENISSNSRILSEVYDLGIVPFNSAFRNISLFNFYDLDQTPDKSLELKSVLSQSEYIILPSQRVLKTRLLNKNEFPIGNKFYKDLLGGKMEYKKVYETPCDIFCKITYLGDPVFSYEQTVNVFDRPTVLIFKKI